MSTLKPRITITLDPRVHEILRRLSKAGGQSMSALVTDFLDLAVPPMERMVVVLEQAAGMSSKTKEGMQAAILRAEANLLPALVAASEQGDIFITDLANQLRPPPSRSAQRGARGASGVVSGLSTPVPLTGGSGHPKPGKKRAVL